MRTAVVDLGLGNLASVTQALVRAGGTPRLTNDPREIVAADRVVLPGVAAFGMGMDRVQRFRGALEEVVRAGTPLLGICLGMQLLFEEGEEDGKRSGLGFLPGKVTRLPAGVQVPHIGWQRLEATRPGLAVSGAWAYFAHSYRCEAPEEVVEAVARHGDVRVAAVVGKGSVRGVQFHPEKSAGDGEALLRRFLQS